MNTHHDRLKLAINDCADVSKLLDIAETCIRASRLFGNIDADEAERYMVRAQQAMRRVPAIRAVGRPQA